MKTGLLFDIPEDEKCPSKEVLLTAFCKEHGIWTERSAHCRDDPWCAMAWKRVAGHFSRPCDGSETQVFDLISKYCSWADDAGLLVCGTSRISVVRKLCENIDLPFPL
jgi:hypothetical protein